MHNYSRFPPSEHHTYPTTQKMQKQNLITTQENKISLEKRGHQTVHHS